MIDDAPAHILVAPVLGTTLPALPQTPIDQNPAAIYLASLGEGSRPTMRTALNTIAAMLGAAERRDALGLDVRCLDVPWAALRYQHTVAIRARLQDRYAPATANKLLAALGRVRREARRLGQIGADDYDRATDLGTIRAERLPRFHDLRHTAATLMLANGVPVVTVSKILGHSSPAITAAIYAHALDEAKLIAIAGLSEQLRRPRRRATHVYYSVIP